MTAATAKTNGRVDIERLKHAAAGRWPAILADVAGIDAALLDGRHHPCPRCGQGVDRFRAFDDFEETGGVLCNQCGTSSDGIAAVQWALGVGFPAACRRIAEYLGIDGHHAERVDLLAQICQRKRIPIEAFRTFGAHEAWRGKLRVVRLPMYDELGAECGYFDLATLDDGWLKGKAVKGHDTGLFLQNGEPPRPGETVLITEGVKDAAALVGEGFRAVGLPTKEMNVRFARLFQRVDVVIVPDRDTAGEKGARATAARLSGVAASVRIATLPAELKAKSGDGVREILGRQNGSELLRRTIEDAVEFTPPTDDESDDADGPIRNAFREDGKLRPLPMGDILGQIKGQTGGWPRQVGSALFVHDGNGEIDWIESAASLFGFIGSKCSKPPKFSTTPGYHTKQEVYSELRRTAAAYDAVELVPHEPLLAGHYYACAIPEPGDGSTLQKLLERFNPETDIDRDLIQAAFVTAIWGGRGGERPCFVFTSDAGRGAGKTSLATAIGDVAGGHIELSAGESVEVIKQRLLSPQGITRRVAVLDNVKSFRFSSAEMEALITTPVISGKRMYVGEGRRPNNLVWIMTLNGVSLATDWAQRSVIVKLQKARYSGVWATETREFIERNRQALIGDCIGFLRSEPTPLASYSRWGSWERDVLARLPEPAEAQRVILERQAIADVEHEETQLVQDFFCEQLRRHEISPYNARVFIPSGMAATWLNSALNEKHGTTASTRWLKQHISEKKMPQLAENNCRTYGRGFVWIGEEASPDEPIDTRLKHGSNGQF